MIYYIIPARKGSKGLPGKNRILFDYTAETLKDKVGDISSMVVVSTDDPVIMAKTQEYRFKAIARPDFLSTDNASMKGVILHAICEIDMKPEDIIVVLYLTYPQRTSEEIQKHLEVFQGDNHSNQSQLCRKEVKESPYLMIDESGYPIIENNLYRRQDYPRVFKRSHYICILKAKYIFQLNENLYNEATGYMWIDNVIDIDTPEDLKEYENSSLHNN